MPISVTPARLIVVLLLILFCGCAEGMLWRTGYINPWARKKWAQEEEIADTLFEKRRQIKELAEQTNAGQANPQQTAKILSEIALKDPIVLIRIEAVKALGEINSPTAIEGLKTASKDPSDDVRLTAIKAWSKKTQNKDAIFALQSAVASDTSHDVRIAAARGLGEFRGPQAEEALTLAINDRDPAIQLSAANSLEKVTGQPFGPDIKQWREYMTNRSNQSPGSTTNPQARQVMFEQENQSNR